MRNMRSEEDIVNSDIAAEAEREIEAKIPLTRSKSFKNNSKSFFQIDGT